MNHDPNRPDQDPEEPTGGSVSNPFDVDESAEAEKPQLNLSPRRAAVLGLSFGLVMVGLLVVCFLGSIALAACIEV